MPGRYFPRLLGMTTAVLGLALGGCRPKTSVQSGAASGGRPVIQQVRLSPSQPRLGDRIVAEAEAVTGNREVFSLGYRWTRNGIAIDNASERELNTKTFKKGDRIGLTVTLKDAQGEGNPFTISEVSLGNCLPRVLQVTMNPTPPMGGGNLTVVAQGEDLDGDAVSFRYQWLRNGQPIPEAKGATLAGNLLKRGDAIEAKIIPWDGSEAGSERTLGPVKVRGRPPVITSEPPADGFSGGVFSYRVTASEPDGERVAFSLTQGPSGMTINSGDGFLRWALPADRGKTYAVTVRVTDEEGAWEEQSFTIRY